MNETIKRLTNEGITSPELIAALVIAEPLTRIAATLATMATRVGEGSTKIADAIGSLESEIHCHG